MKKGALIFAVLFLISIFAVAGVLGASQVDVGKAYTCLENQIGNTTCSSMGIEEQIFSVLSTGLCKTNLINAAIKDSSNNSICWPAQPGDMSCSVQMTAEAMIALNNSGVDTSLPEQWLLNQTITSTDLNWFLEVDATSGAQSCSVGYETTPGVSTSFSYYPFTINSSGVINSSAGNCLSLSNGNYWFSINPSCFDREFQTHCNGTFKTTVLFQDANPNSPPTYYVSQNVNTSTGGIISNFVNSYCLGSGASCNYLGTLWGSIALDIVGNSYSKFIPYLSTIAQDNPQDFPSSFLYLLTGNPQYSTNIFNLQSVTTGAWNGITGRGQYYDTALALLPFQGRTGLTQVQNAENWLANSQMSDGCWDSNSIVSTSFLLYSLWPNQNGNGGALSCSDVQYQCVSGASSCTGTVENQYTCSSGICCNPNPSGSTNLCTSNGDSCIFSSQCAAGAVVSQYSNSCPSATICCSSQVNSQTCSQQGGVVCQSNQYCSGGEPLTTASGLQYGQTCCLSPGVCANTNNNNSNTPSSTCSSNGGICASACSTGYSASSAYSCSDSTEVCCVVSPNVPSSSTSYWWVWVLFILVVLAVVGILYRDKIKEFLQKMQARKGSRGGRGSPGMNGGNLPPRYPPPYERSPQIGAPMPRKIIPSSSPQRPLQRQLPKQRSSEEMDEVLRKLKEIGK